jgi:hypothetical protein
VTMRTVVVGGERIRTNKRDTQRSDVSGRTAAPLHAPHSTL